MCLVRETTKTILQKPLLAYKAVSINRMSPYHMLPEVVPLHYNVGEMVYGGDYGIFLYANPEGLKQYLETYPDDMGIRVEIPAGSWIVRGTLRYGDNDDRLEAMRVEKVLVLT